MFMFSGKMGVLSDELKRLSPTSCAELLVLLLNHQNRKAPTVSKHLLQKTWQSQDIDCSGVQLKVLLENKRSKNMLAKFLKLGMLVGVEDVRLAMCCLAPSDIDLFELICEKCKDLDADSMCNEAFSLNKNSFVLHFLKNGAKTIPGDALKLFMAALENKDFSAAKILVKMMDKDALVMMNLGHLFDTTNVMMDPELVRLVVEHGVKLCGRSPLIPMVMQTPFPKDADLIEVLCILVEHGVDCKQLCQTSHDGATPLHVATELAIKSSK